MKEAYKDYSMQIILDQRKTVIQTLFLTIKLLFLINESLLINQQNDILHETF